MKPDLLKKKEQRKQELFRDWDRELDDCFDTTPFHLSLSDEQLKDEVIWSNGGTDYFPDSGTAMKILIERDQPGLLTFIKTDFIDFYGVRWAQDLALLHLMSKAQDLDETWIEWLKSIIALSNDDCSVDRLFLLEVLFQCSDKDETEYFEDFLSEFYFYEYKFSGVVWNSLFSNLDCYVRPTEKIYDALSKLFRCDDAFAAVGIATLFGAEARAEKLILSTLETRTDIRFLYGCYHAYKIIGFDVDESKEWVLGQIKRLSRFNREYSVFPIIEPYKDNPLVRETVYRVAQYYDYWTANQIRAIAKLAELYHQEEECEEVLRSLIIHEDLSEELSHKYMPYEQPCVRGGATTTLGKYYPSENTRLFLIGFIDKKFGYFTEEIALTILKNHPGHPDIISLISKLLRVWGHFDSEVWSLIGELSISNPPFEKFLFDTFSNDERGEGFMAAREILEHLGDRKEAKELLLRTVSSRSLYIQGLLDRYYDFEMAKGFISSTEKGSLEYEAAVCGLAIFPEGKEQAYPLIREVIGAELNEEDPYPSEDLLLTLGYFYRTEETFQILKHQVRRQYSWVAPIIARFFPDHPEARSVIIYGLKEYYPEVLEEKGDILQPRVLKKYI